MDSQVEAALVDVILDEVKSQRYTATEMQARTGIKSRSWQNYFRQRTRPIPIKAVYAIADVLGVSGSELMRRAELRESAPTATEIAERAVSDMSPDAQAEVREARRRMGVDDGPEEQAPPAVNH